MRRAIWIALLMMGAGACDRPLPSNPDSPPVPTPTPVTTPGDSAARPPGEGATAAPSPSSAPLKPPAADCRALQTQAEMTACAGKSAEEADQTLNQVYQQLQAQLTDAQQDERLVEAQLAWIEFRDRDCEFDQGRFEGGSLEPMTYSLCIARKTQQRTDELQDYLEQLQGVRVSPAQGQG